MKQIIILVCCLLLVTIIKNDQINLFEHDATVNSKKKQYCGLISIHFFEADMDEFNKYTKDFTPERTQFFKDLVSKKLIQNCVQKISSKQMLQLYKIISNPKDSSLNKFEDLQQKYAQYFKPEEKIILKVLEEIKSDTDNHINQQLQAMRKSHQELKLQTKIITDSFEHLGKNLESTTQGIAKAVHEVQTLFSQIFRNMTVAIQNFRNHSTFKQVKQFIQDL